MELSSSVCILTCAEQNSELSVLVAESYSVLVFLCG